MNRLIIIGNGFDLAHGIKTSYKDFITEYLCNAVNLFYEVGSYSDCLIEIGTDKIKNALYDFSQNTKSEKISLNNALIKFKEIQKNKNNTVEFKSLLLDNSLKKINQLNWVDLETEYFNVY